jgi:hypothetical protein
MNPTGHDAGEVFIALDVYPRPQMFGGKDSVALRDSVDFTNPLGVVATWLISYLRSTPLATMPPSLRLSCRPRPGE